MGFDGKIPEGMPVYEFIKQELRRQIETGVLKEGGRVPSELELARALKVSRSQTRLALRDLEMTGFLVRSPGRGSFVAPVGNRTRRVGMRGFRMVGMASLEFHSLCCRKIIENFTRRMLAADFRTLMCFLGLRDERELEFVQESRNTGIEGLVWWLQDRSDAARAVLNALRESAFPCVLCDRYMRGVDIDHVVTDNVDVGYRLTHELLRQGHRRIAFLTLWLNMTPTEDRLEGYRKALTEADIPVDPELVGSFDTPGTSPAGIVKSVLASRERPTAIFCTDDWAFKFTTGALQRLGYSLPGDMAFASVNDDDHFAHIDVPVLCARQNAEEIGRQTADLLLARIAEPRKEVEQRFVKAHFGVLGKVGDTAAGKAAWEGGDSGPRRDVCASPDEAACVSPEARELYG